MWSAKTILFPYLSMMFRSMVKPIHDKYMTKIWAQGWMNIPAQKTAQASNLSCSYSSCRLTGGYSVFFLICQNGNHTRVHMSVSLNFFNVSQWSLKTSSAPIREINWWRESWLRGWQRLLWNHEDPRSKPGTSHILTDIQISEWIDLFFFF